MSQFAEAVSVEGLKEAIANEIAYVSYVKESGKVTGMGDHSKPVVEIQEAQLRESWKRMNPNWTEEQVTAALRG